MRPNLCRRRAALSLRVLLVVTLVGAASLVAPARTNATRAAAGGVPPSGFSDVVAISGLVEPTTVAFAADGRVFVAEKSGLIKVFDLAGRHHAHRLRGSAHPGAQLLGPWAAGPRPRPAVPDPAVRVRALLVRRGARGHSAALGHRRRYRRRLSEPAGFHCRRVRRAGAPLSPHGQRRPDDRARAGSRERLVPAVPQSLDRHRRLRARRRPLCGAGEGASFNYVDYGQTNNPCGDPPSPAGTDLAPPTAQGGALRSQSVRRPAGQPVSLGGTIIRVDPNTGAGMAGNPFAASADQNARRIIAYGLRNPFRFDRPPRDATAVGRRGRVEHLGGDQQDRRRRRWRGRELRLAVLRGHWPAGRATTRPT